MKIKKSRLEKIIKEEVELFRKNHGVFLKEDHLDGNTNNNSSSLHNIKKLGDALEKIILFINNQQVVFPQRQEVIRNIENSISIIKKVSLGKTEQEENIIPNNNV